MSDMKDFFIFLKDSMKPIKKSYMLFIYIFYPIVQSLVNTNHNSYDQQRSARTSKIVNRVIIDKFLINIMRNYAKYLPIYSNIIDFIFIVMLLILYYL